MSQIPNLFDTFTARESLINRRGVFTWKKTTSLLALTERRLDTPGELPVIKRKVFNAVTEALQNAVKHQPCNLRVGRFSIFMLGQETKKYFILTGNVMLKSGVGSLRKKLIRLNNLNKTGLRSAYLRHLQHGRISKKGGAGLGLTQLARISTGKLEFQFSKIDQAHSYFILKLSVV